MKDIPRKRNGYYYREGSDKPFVSVTKVLGDVLSKPALIYWTGQQASDIALHNPYLTTKEVMATLQLQQKETQDRGKAIHAIAEILAAGGPYMPDNRYPGYSEALWKWWQINKPEPIDSEVEVFNDRIEVAGRLDFICKIRDYVCLVDWKTGSGIYKESGLQLAFYADTLKENKIITIERKIVVLCMETGEFQEKDTNDEIWEFENCLEVWKWLKKKGL